MADLVQQPFLSLRYHLRLRSAVQLVRPLVDDDSVRKHHRIAVAALRQRHTGVDAKQVASAPDARSSQLLGRRPPAHLDIEILQRLLEDVRKLLQRLLDHPFELAPRHLGILYMSSRPQRRAWPPRRGA